MNETLFYVFGIGLVLSAIAVSAIGLRLEAFPASRAILAVVIVYFAGMVAATSTFAVLNAAEEQEDREAEEAEGIAEPAPTTPQTTTPGPPAAPSKETTVKLAADPNAIAYDATELSAKPGTVTIDLDNPSAVAHDVCVTGADGGELGCSETIASGTATFSADLEPATYTFFCSVDGHQQAGMRGTLTVQ